MRTTNALVAKCDTGTFTAEITADRYGRGEISESEVMRVGPIATPFMLHVSTGNPDFDCPQLDIQRVVECPNGCEFDEFSYPMPTACTAHHLLPAGTYDIKACNQSVYPLEVGSVLDINLTVEPVTDSFAAIYQRLSADNPAC